MNLWYWELRHRWKYLGQKYRPKSPIEVYNTIITYGFGLDNYTVNRGKFKRKKGN